MTIHHGGAVIYAKDPKRIADFYSQVAGMHAGRAAPDHIVLESGAFQLVIVQVPERIAKTIAVTVPPARQEEVPIKLVFFVGSIVQARRIAAECGGALNDARREWLFDGSTVCDGCDPEGTVFQLRQAESKAGG